MASNYDHTLTPAVAAISSELKLLRAELSKLKIAMVGIGLLLGSQRYEEPEKFTGVSHAMAEDAMEHLHDALGLEWTPRCARDIGNTDLNVRRLRDRAQELDEQAESSEFDDPGGGKFIQRHRLRIKADALRAAANALDDDQ